MVIISILCHSQMNLATHVRSGIPLREEGHGPLVAAVWWSPTLNTLCVRATI